MAAARHGADERDRASSRRAHGLADLATDVHAPMLAARIRVEPKENGRRTGPSIGHVQACAAGGAKRKKTPPETSAARRKAE